jgi:ParB family protein of integrating conjugative element (PFGI_1 class)
MMTKPDELPMKGELSQVDVTLIRHYSRNPRRQQNPEYDRIKASIEAEGLDQPLVLSQEPDTSGYVLHSGGNTRLRILQELYAETGEERYRWVTCLLRPWSTESNVLFAHLRENELRGGLPFIDKALAVFDAKALLESELSVESLSQRQLEIEFRKRGFGLSHSMISKMGYAVEVLWPVMPKALSGGLGRPQIEKIRSLERAATAIWCRRKLGDAASFEPVFAELCRRYDGPEWDIQPLRDALVNEIAVESEQDRQVIQLELDAQLTGRPFDSLGYHDHEMPEECAHGTGAADPLESRLVDDLVKTEEKAAGSEIPPTPLGDVAGKATAKSVAGANDHVGDFGHNKNLDNLRSRLADCAVALADTHGLGGIITRLPEYGTGYMLIDVPPMELKATLDQDTLAFVSALWWQLAAGSDLTTAPTDWVLSCLDEDSALRHALASQDAGLLFASVWTPDPGFLSSQLWQQLSPTEWTLFLNMVTAYRDIKHLADENGIALWPCPDQDTYAVQ